MRGILSEFSPLLISWNGSGATKTLMKVEWMGGFAPVEGDSLLSAFYLNELLLRLTPREDPEERLFVAYWDALKVLATESAPPAIGSQRSARLSSGSFATRGTVSLRSSATASMCSGVKSSCTPGHQRLRAVLIMRRDTLKSVVKLDFSNPLSVRAAKSLFRGVIASLLGDRPLNTRRILSELKRL